MNIRFLETAVSLAKHKSFRITAEQLHTTQAAISSRIAVLEEEFGQRLFDRNTKQVNLTQAGVVFVDAAAEVLASYSLLQKKMRKSSGLEGVIRIGAVSSMVHFLLPELIARIRKLYPDVALDVMTDDTGKSFPEQLKQGIIDFCLTALPDNPPPEIETRALCSIDMAWVSSPQLIADNNTPMSVADLARYPIITYAQGSVNGERIKTYLQDASPGQQSFLTSSSLSASIRMAVQGLGLAIIPEFVAAREIDEGQLLKLHLAQDYPATHYCSMYSQVSAKSGIADLAELCSNVCTTLCSQSTGAMPSAAH